MYPVLNQIQSEWDLTSDHYIIVLNWYKCCFQIVFCVNFTYIVLLKTWLAQRFLVKSCHSILEAPLWLESHILSLYLIVGAQICFFYWWQLKPLPVCWGVQLFYSYDFQLLIRTYSEYVLQSPNKCWRYLTFHISPTIPFRTQDTTPQTQHQIHPPLILAGSFFEWHKDTNRIPPFELQSPTCSGT